MKRKWIRRTELKELEMQRVQALRTARADRPDLWTRLQRAAEGVIRLFQKLGEVIAGAAKSVVEFLAKVMPVVEHQQHQQLATGIAGLMGQKQNSAIGQVKLLSAIAPIPIPISSGIELRGVW